MKKLAWLVQNIQHRELPEQIELLDAEYEQVNVVTVPPDGWTQAQVMEQADRLMRYILDGADVVFLSPVPLLLRELAWRCGRETERGWAGVFVPRLFHNDRREKKELPDGRIIQTVAQTGWMLL